MNQLLEVIWLSLLLIITLFFAFLMFAVAGLLIIVLFVLSALGLVIASPFLMVLYAVEALVRALNRGKTNVSE